MASCADGAARIDDARHTAFAIILYQLEFVTTGGLVVADHFNFVRVFVKAEK